MDGGMCLHNFCWSHHSLRLGEEVGARYKWKERTPAMAAGLTEHIWTIEELLRYRIPLPEWVAPKKKKKKRRPSKQAPPPQPAMELAA